MGNHILVVDDDDSIRMLVADVLRDAGYRVTALSSGEAALTACEVEKFDLILLDIMLGGISGLDVCREIRERTMCPIIFVSAKNDSSDIVRGLGLGGDDYITKPFSIDEILARVEAHLRRQERMSAGSSPAQRITIGAISADPDSRTVTLNGERVDITSHEFDLLIYLMKNAGQTLSKEQIFRDVWRTQYGDMGTVAINIKNLRTKLDPDRVYIQTVWGSGYRFVTQSGISEGDGNT